METISHNVAESSITTEPVTISEVLQLASWERPRSDEEIHSLLERRQQALGAFTLDEILVA